MRKQVFTSYILNAATGEWSKKEAPGPPNITAWEQGFRTFKCAMLLIQAADSERLDAYMDFVKDLNNQFSHECWGIIYKAEVRMRSEYMERIKRDLTANPKHGFTEAAPWSAVFYATRETEYWTKEVTTPATLFVAPNSESSEGAAPRPAAKKASKKRKYKGADSSVLDDKDQIYARNKKGIEICKKFNLGQCGNGKAQSRCPNKRSHQCNKCMGPHSAQNCSGSKKGDHGKGEQKPPEPAQPPRADPKKRKEPSPPKPKKAMAAKSKPAVNLVPAKGQTAPSPKKRQRRDPGDSSLQSSSSRGPIQGHPHRTAPERSKLSKFSQI